MIHLEKSDCCGCHACAQVCPKHCITMKPDEEGFLYPQVDETVCIHCNACEKVCPVLQKQLPEETKNAEPEAYAGINLDEKIRQQSSSGGIFTLLAEQTLHMGGIVFGAAMTKDQHSVHHIAVESAEQLAALRGSKYLQSEIGNTYLQVQKELQKGRKVLFSGTPCQVEGLYAFLHWEDPNLLCVDIICHGVPSPLVWDRYLTEREACAGAPVKQAFFRNKQHGWKAYTIKLIFCNDVSYEKVFTGDPFMKAFLQNICLRPSCYACHFKKLSRVSDITLADYWGIQDQYPEMDDDKGTSLVIVHSEKGKRCIELLGDKVRLKKVPVEQALRGNPSMLHSSEMHKQQKQFFSQLGKKPFDRVVTNCCREKITVKRIIRAVLKRMGVGVVIQMVKHK